MHAINFSKKWSDIFILESVECQFNLLMWDFQKSEAAGKL